MAGGVDNRNMDGGARRILCPVDFSDESSRALKEAIARFPGCEQVLLHVVDGELPRRVAQQIGLDPEGIAAQAWNHADVRLEETVAQLASRGANARALLERADAAVETARVVAREKVDLVIVRVRPLAADRDGGRFRTRLSRLLPCPLVLVPFTE